MNPNGLLSKRAIHLKPSATMEMDALAKTMIAQGRDVLNLTAGQPHMKPAQVIIEATCQAARQGLTGYTPSRGTPELLKAIALKFKNDNGLKFDPLTELVSGNGAKSILAAVLGAVVESGDEVIVPVPYWTTYPELVEFWGGKVTHYNLANGIAGLAKVIKECKQLKAFILNSPCNPSGQVLSKTEIKELAQIVEDHKVLVITDEIYEYLVFGDNKHYSIAHYLPKELVVVVNGVSKAYSMTGYRIGYAGGPEYIIAAVARILSQLAGCPSSISQAAALVALTTNRVKDAVADMVFEYENHVRNYIIPFAENMKNQQLTGFDYVPPQGAFYFWFKLPDKFQGKCKAFCQSLIKLEKGAVGLVPGVDFGMPGWVRLSFATAEDILDEGLTRLSKYLILAE